jgi:hypothetical protein
MRDSLTGDQVLRTAGLALLAGAIVIDAFAPVLVRWRRAVAANAVKLLDDVAPTENVLLDVSIGLLHVSDRWRT